MNEIEHFSKVSVGNTAVCRIGIFKTQCRWSRCKVHPDAGAMLPSRRVPAARVVSERYFDKHDNTIIENRLNYQRYQTTRNQ